MKITKFFLLFITVLSLLAGSVSAYRAPVSAQTLPVQIELRGTISGVVGDEITIAGQKVVRYPVTQVAGTIAVGATAKVDGALSADGSILARQITSPSDKLAEIQAFGNIVEITGAVGATTPTAITIMGKTMTIGAQTQVTGTVQVGAQVKLEGSFQPDGTILLRQVLTPPTVAIATAQPGAMKGLFGTVTAKGADSITINTAAEGTVNIKIDATTRFRMPGRDAIGKDDLQVDDRLAILARKSTTDILTATDVMVVPGQPQNQHVVGAVTGIQGANVTITKPDGSKVTIEMAGALPKLGGVLTVVTEMESKSGKMRSRSWQRVEQVEDRLVTRVKELEKEDPKGKAGEIEHLRGLVEDNAAHHLGILSEVRDRVEVEARGRMNEAFEDARHSEDDMLRGLGMKGAQVETRGTISNINLANNKVTIQPQQGAAIELQVNSASRIHKDNNERATLADLKAEDTLRVVRFNPDSKELVRLVAKTPKVESAMGTIITSINQANRTFVMPHFLERTEVLVLNLNNDSKITRDGAPSTMDKLVAGDIVEKVEFKDGSLMVNNLTVLSASKAVGKVVQLAGRVDSVSISNIMVSGHMVDISTQSKFKGRASVGALARVQATVQSNGSLLAQEINISQSRGRSGKQDENENLSLQGLVERASATELVISGKKIAINSQTKTEGRLEAGSMARVEVQPQLDGSLLATEIKAGESRSRLGSRDELDALGNVMQLTGAIQSISDTQIVISGHKITRTAQTEVKGTLTVGAMAKAEGSLQADGSILAREIKSPVVVRVNARVAGNDMELVGNIESVTATQIIIFGKKINRDAVTEVKGTLQAGALAKVEGSLQPDGSILARQIKSPPDAKEELEARTRRSDPIGIRGTIQSVTGNDMIIAGKKISRDARTEMTGTPQAGATVKISGGLQADGSILASQIKIPSDKLAEIQARGNLVELTGVIESMAANQIMALGQKVVTNAQTQTAGALQSGTIVKIEGTLQADGTIVAREVFVLPHILEIRGREVELRGRAAEGEIRGRESEGEIRGREAEARGRAAEGEGVRGGADSPGDDRGGSSGGGGGSSGSGK